MKYLTILFGLSFILACSKNCDSNNTACSEQPQSGVVCQAYFENWFFDQNTKNCSLIAYSGCEALGFETKEECTQCSCTDD